MVNNILTALNDPHWSRARRPSYEWESGSHFRIREKKVLNFTINFNRVRWLEDLKLIRIFVFVPTRPDTMVSIDGVEMTQNQWVYHEVWKILAADRLILLNRLFSVLNNPQSPLGLPAMPLMYKFLEVSEEPPRFTEMEARAFHGHDV